MHGLPHSRSLPIRGEKPVTSYKVGGIGNAIVDVLSEAEDTFLDLMGIDKGIMQLVERKRGEMLYGAMMGRVEEAGGSVANTMAGLGNLGLSTAFIGRVRDDALGRFYAAEMERIGCFFANGPVEGGELPTSRSMIFVSPDGERSMNTYLGISAELGPDDVADDVAGGCEFLFLAGYLYDKPKGKEAFERASKLCRAALERAAEECKIVVCTRSGSDVVLVEGDEEAVVPVERITPVDATGAGDQFAAGFLYGLVTGRDLETCGRMGCVAAAEVISHMGPRPVVPLMGLFEDAGLV